MPVTINPSSPIKKTIGALVLVLVLVLVLALQALLVFNQFYLSEKSRVQTAAPPATANGAAPPRSCRRSKNLDSLGWWSEWPWLTFWEICPKSLWCCWTRNFIKTRCRINRIARSRIWWKSCNIVWIFTFFAFRVEIIPKLSLKLVRNLGVTLKIRLEKAVKNRRRDSRSSTEILGVLSFDQKTRRTAAKKFCLRKTRRKISENWTKFISWKYSVCSTGCICIQMIIF